MKDHFLNLLEYDNWANTKILNSIIAQNVDNENIKRILSHISLAQKIWYLRLTRQKKVIYDMWEVLKISECSDIFAANYQGFKKFIMSQNEENLSETITYKNSKGNEYSNTISDMLIQVSLHSVYHRGQIAREMRLINKEPVLTDYIAFVREKKQ